MSYRGDADVSDQVASRDLRLLVDAGLLEARGERRGRFYVRTPKLLELDERIRGQRQPKSLEDPFELAAQAVERPLGDGRHTRLMKLDSAAAERRPQDV